MINKIINLQERRDAAQNKELEEIVDFVTETEEALIEFLAKAYIECEREGDPKLGKDLIDAGLNLKIDQMHCDILNLIKELKGNNDGTSSD